MWGNVSVGMGKRVFERSLDDSASEAEAGMA